MDKIIRFLILVPIAFLLLALTRMPYGYYDVMRIVVSLVTSVFLIKECIAFFKHKTWERAVLWSLIFVGIVLLFNPLAPFRFPRQTWTLFNIGAAILLFIYFLSYEFKSTPPVGDRTDQNRELKLITKIGEHSDLLREALLTAKSSVVIASPYLSQNAMNVNTVDERIKAAVARGVNVKVFCNPDFNDGSQKKVQDFNQCVQYLEGAKAQVYKRNHHSKFICVDSEWLVIGSFNWLSAANNPRSIFSRKEVSLRYSGGDAAGMVSDLRGKYRW
ncbi:DUF6804 family protein [Cephaloticoccus primus]|uniref:DUF6804 family protein n=1 Tax=Cephaloticoccus primus TaxID=1548207 RepID=UPI0009ED88A9|nr:DUF6804 family protein [Cephaloticoccus primus]